MKKTTKKTRGISLLETILTLGLTGLLVLSAQPALFAFLKSREALAAIHAAELKSARIPELIRDAVVRAADGDTDFPGSDDLKGGKGLYEAPAAGVKQLNQAFFAAPRTEGNFLFLELPTYKSEKITTKLIAFKIKDGIFSMIQYSVSDDVLKQSREDPILTGVEGNFALESNTIRVLLRFTKGEKPQYLEVTAPWEEDDG